MYLSKLKSGIKDFTSLVQRIPQCLPDSLCYLCQQPTQKLICQICEQDCLFFNTPIIPDNLLLWPPIKKGLVSGRYTSVHACSYYQWPMDHLINQFKNGHPQLTQTLADWFVAYALPSEPLLPDCILPVPTSSWRFARRRYHQTLLLANAIGRRLSIPVHANWASRRSFQRKQQSLGRRERLNNLKQAFTLSKDPLPQRVAILDDVVTTGATAAALSNMIYSAYPETSVALWALAITPAKADPGALVSGQIRQQRVLLQQD